ncbi:MAG: bifunctional 5,10-methylenetetrahydrofolate dehydrogenase/5,10-methenyltetrahydrofolate cyclohydrolase [Phycisphaerae bacterium]|nr:bifunctional 5,10-methylenetetrahydrofolate dehydrogenase/5,10-methenyltetrahydrofolate cyclohydrolase [Phycisphaerae bacterium]
MGAQILDGTVLAEQARAQVRAQVAELRRAGASVKLASLIVGSPPPGMLYAGSQRKTCEQVGIEYDLRQLPDDADARAIIAEITRLNHDPSVTGILLLMPMPDGVDPTLMQYHIDPYKDVEGVNPSNIGFCFYGEPIIAPCAALAAVELVRASGRELRGSEAVVVGQGAIVGRPITTFLLHEMATVTGCHIATRDLIAHTRRADILVVAVGKPNLIRAKHVKPGAVVIDVGVNRITSTGGDGKTKTVTVGDVAFDEVKEVAGAITPVPGGVGPVTVAMLLRNTVEAARKQMEGRKHG